MNIIRLPEPIPEGMAQPHDPYVSLRNPNFLWYVASYVAVTLGTQIQATVVAWQVYALTRDPLSLGIVGLAEALPFISAALYAGHIADRHNRKTLSLIAIGVQVLCGIALLVLTVRSDVFLAGRVWPIYGVVSASGLVRSFLQPARVALGAEIVPRETYANAVNWRSSLWQFAAVMGPALGGLIYGFSGASLAYGVEAVLCAIALLLLARIVYTRSPIIADAGTIGQSLTTCRSSLRKCFTSAPRVLEFFARPPQRAPSSSQSCSSTVDSERPAQPSCFALLVLGCAGFSLPCPGRSGCPWCC
jgi:MFS family permease